MAQQGQVFKLRQGRNGNSVWAYRYRLDGRGSRRPQVGGFATRAEAQEALRRTLDRLRPGGRAATVTLAELVEEYLEVHQAEPTTIAKLRWLLGKATCMLGDVRVVHGLLYKSAAHEGGVCCVLFVPRDDCVDDPPGLDLGQPLLVLEYAEVRDQLPDPALAV